MPNSRYIDIAGAPNVPGLRFRHWAGPEDYPGMVGVLERSKAEDNEDGITTADDLRNSYENIENCDKSEDVLIVELDGRIEGYARHSWTQEPSGLRRYEFVVNATPLVRRLGVREAMLAWVEGHVSKLAKGHPPGEKVLDAWASEDEVHLTALLESRGFEVVRIGASMVRPNLDGIPDLPLPVGVEVRPARPEHYRYIFDTHIDAFRESWGFSEGDWDKVYAQFSSSKVFQPHLWQIAWHGDEVVGQVKPFILEEENADCHRKRGYIEFISTKKAWRGKGIASALIARALRRVRDEGMEEAALGVDTGNVHNAMKLYERMGFRKDKLGRNFRKPVA